MQRKAIPTWRREANRRRRGVVLVLVVSALAFLFVAGAALLTTVSFSTQTLDALSDAIQKTLSAISRRRGLAFEG